MKIDIDWGLCDGNGICAIEAPGYFDLDDDDELQVLRTDVTAQDAAAVDRAVVGCPKHALTLSGPIGSGTVGGAVGAGAVGEPAGEPA